MGKSEASSHVRLAAGIVGGRIPIQTLTEFDSVFFLQLQEQLLSSLDQAKAEGEALSI